MNRAAASVERAIRRLLDSGALPWLTRIALALPFASSALEKATHWSSAVIETAQLGFRHAPMVAAATIATQTIGSVLLFTRRLCWLGAGMLAVFTLCASVVAHAFWAMSGPARGAEMATFFEHIAIVGGFAALAALVDRIRH